MFRSQWLAVGIRCEVSVVGRVALVAAAGSGVVDSGGLCLAQQLQSLASLPLYLLRLLHVVLASDYFGNPRAVVPGPWSVSVLELANVPAYLYRAYFCCPRCIAFLRVVCTLASRPSQCRKLSASPPGVV